MWSRLSLGSGRALPTWQHYLCWSDVPVPRISVIFSLEELKEIEKDCAIYVGRMERVARHSSVSKEEKVRGPRLEGFPHTFLPFQEPEPALPLVFCVPWLGCPGQGPCPLLPKLTRCWRGSWLFVPPRAGTPELLSFP